MVCVHTSAQLNVVLVLQSLQGDGQKELLEQLIVLGQKKTL